ncbi:SAM-dependent methyltransferase [Qipengyuania sp. DY56-A-20]|uniref:SAM-dependent methyltransferase n=1 Tax=Qipengyuania benthica TaxID=3067651 RepID=A0ABT9H4P9_9SPHN|nr:SAM-dependent methyltransferase [Qipengyuania sp. DY56-A-20]MDP4538273.1 SAM-dependent methyltransferase [Qipengyuania sp. DY56-A-20]
MTDGGRTDLAEAFARLIRSGGPIPVARFMGESNARYYAARDPLGATGDFVTAPDISQMFGEMVGLWLADLWVRAGRPADAVYAELGPGRGTLARDALRVMRGQGLEPQVHLVEGSPALRKIQAEALHEAVFHDDLGSLPEDRPLLLVANEFLDALPVRQLVRTEAGWRERMVALAGEDAAEGFVFTAGTQPMDAAVPEAWRDAPPGTLVETCPGAAAALAEVARRLTAQGGAALFVDYGHLAARNGSSLQAVREHAKVDPLAYPGTADLTAHVDFATLAEIAKAGGVPWIGGTTQGSFLSALGIDARARALSAAAPDRAEDIAVALRRLVHVDEMGKLFKVLALSGGGWPPGAGFLPAR